MRPQTVYVNANNLASLRIEERLAYADTSQFGNRCHLRNMTYAGRRLPVQERGFAQSGTKKHLRLTPCRQRSNRRLWIWCYVAMGFSDLAHGI